MKYKPIRIRYLLLVLNIVLLVVLAYRALLLPRWWPRIAAEVVVGGKEMRDARVWRSPDGTFLVDIKGVGYYVNPRLQGFALATGDYKVLFGRCFWLDLPPGTVPVGGAKADFDPELTVDYPFMSFHDGAIVSSKRTLVTIKIPEDAW